MNKAVLIVTCLAFSLVTLAMPTVTRRINSDNFASGGIYRVELAVTFPDGEARPTAMIISENWPQEFRVVESHWNGSPFMPVDRGDCRSWLFGYGDGNPAVSPGTISYIVTAPENAARSKDQILGTVSIVGQEEAICGESDIIFQENGTIPAAELLQLQSGWNLLELPFATDVTSRELAGGLANAVFTYSEDSWVQAESALLAPAAPLWIWRNAPGELYLTGTASQKERQQVTFPGEWRLGQLTESAVATESWQWVGEAYQPNTTGSTSKAPHWQSNALPDAEK